MDVITGIKNRANAYRNPVYLLYSFFGIGLFILSALIANSGVGSVELALFDVFNNMSNAFYTPMILIAFFGSVGAIPVVVLIAVFRKHYANAIKILLSSAITLVLLDYIGNLNIRQLSQDIISKVDTRQIENPLFSFPSTYMAIAAILALTSYIYLPKRFHKVVSTAVVLVGISQMYLGYSFPVDLIGGFGIGLFVGGLFNFIFGSRHYSPVDPAKVKDTFNTLGHSVSSVKIASVDARGSVPYVAKGKKTNYFIKVVGFENNVADWLFKLFRRIVYKRLEDEQPYMSPKRQLEHEAYVAMLAIQSGVDTPRIAGIFEADTGRWAMAQEMIDGQSLDRVDAKAITNTVIDKIWLQVKILHDNKIVHRDLRAANVFLDDNGNPWMIDFGFSEGSASEETFYRDTVELVASLSLLVGVDRTVKSAKKILGKKELMGCLPYIGYASLSGATTTGLKKQKGMLKELQHKMLVASGSSKVKTVKLKRFDLKFFLILVSLGVAINVLAPQLVSFKDSFEAAKDAKWHFVAIGVVLSAFTYILAGVAYKFISIYPLQLWPTVVVQVASSFASKLAPAGTGGMALNGRYLYKNNHSTIQAGAVAAINTILGLMGHISVVLMISVFTEGSIFDLIPEIHVPKFIFIIVGLSIVTTIISFRIFPAFRKIFVKNRHKLTDQFKYYRENYLKLIMGYIVSVTITLTYAATLYVCALALGVQLSVLDVVYVFTVGAIVSSVTPTPGGLGGAEAAYVASLTSLGVTSSLALTITLLYRLLTFWLPILPGFIAFRFATNKEYI